jgi:hypothetical protein
MYRKFISPFYIFNMIIQSLVSLISPIALTFAAAWALNTYLNVGAWIYVVLILVGALAGLYSMVSFLLKASAAIEALDRQHKEKEKSKAQKNTSGNSNEKK